MDHAARGKKALEASNYEEAIKEYTAALEQSPESPDYYINRSTAHQRNKNSAAALEDAERGVVYARKRAKRELITEAQFRRGCALYTLGRYGDAKFILDLVKKMKSDHKMADMWLNKTALALKQLPEGDEKGLCTAQETPTLPTAKEPEGSKSQPVPKTETPTETKPEAVAPRLEQIKHDFYQNSQNVYFTLLAKGVNKDTAQIEIKERSLSINFPLANDSSYDLTFDPLYAEVRPNDSTVRLLPTKIEVVLAKVTQGQKWPAMEGIDPDVKTAAATANPTRSQATSSSTTQPIAPSYPTSSKSGPKDWDKVVQDLRSSEKGDKEGKADDDDDDDAGGDPTNTFFKKLFKGASPEMQRAMVKSYTESNGTALSTNWEEVSKGKVETSPPDGMEAKNWSA